MIITSAPIRLSIGGGGTDLPFYSSRHGGELTSVGIDKYIYIIIQKRDFFNDEFLIRYSKVETPKRVVDISHTRIKAALKLLEIDEPIEITALADVPARTGLGSSSAFLVALLKALHQYKRESVSSKVLAEQAFYIENHMLGEPLGKQDQYVAAYGGLIHLDIDKFGEVIVSPLDIKLTTMEELESSLLLFSTAILHDSCDVLEDQKKQALSDEKKIEGMHQIKIIGRKIKCFLEAGDTTQVGHLLHEHWICKKQFSEKITSPVIDNLYDFGMANGALGGKLVGAGGGGFLMFYCKEDKQRLRDAFESRGLKELSFRFDTGGCRIVFDGK